MLSAQERATRGVTKTTYAGAGVGFISYLVIGLIPGLLYGGYAGMLIAGALLGTPVEATLAAKAITFGGVLFGALASLFIFLVIGAVAGSVVGVLVRPLFLRNARQAEAAEREELEAVVRERLAEEMLRPRKDGKTQARRSTSRRDLAGV